MIEQQNKLELKINIKFKDQELLKKSLIHKSHNTSDHLRLFDDLRFVLNGSIVFRALLRARGQVVTVASRRP